MYKEVPQMGTKKILNKDVSNVVEESLAGYLMAYRKYYKKVGEYNAFTYKGHRKDKVALVIGGGSGHEPLFTGYCGAGLADAVACGNVCASPNPELIMEAAKAVDQGKGVLFVYGNYAGDNLNFDMAEEMCQAEGMKTAHVREWDDFASAPKERITDRRGIAGDVYTIKIAGAACDAGLSLEEVVRITEKARDNTNTIGLATSPGTLPGNDKPTFEIADDEMEFGMGLHGEPGIERTKMMPCSDMVDRMYKELKEEMEKKSLEAIQERGGAQVGDKTMVDALSPAVDALAANADKGLLEMLKAAEASAKQGVEDTKKYVAKFGRAKSLLERAIGHQDAGATSVYLIFQGMREFVEGKLA